VSDLDAHPTVVPFRSAAVDRPVAVRYEERDVPLGGVRGMRVRRLLPQRTLPTVGAWCFLDQYGPERHEMGVLPHPHIGLQTVTWIFAGQVRHRDSLGSDAVIRPGQLNLMTAGRGVVHSEFSLGGPSLLHGLQLWVALPAGVAGRAPAFEQHRELPRYVDDGLTATVLVGQLGAVVSPATAYSPLVGAELTMPAGAVATVPLRPDYEYAVLAVDGTVDIDGNPLAPGPLLYLGTGRSALPVTASRPARAMLLGGAPFTDDLVMWWNFVGRSHDDIATARADWEAGNQARFGPVGGHGADRIPAPELGGIHLRPRHR
jgi:quercetin 2,3-dioxygenase